MGGLWIERVCTELDCDTLDTLRWLPYLLLLLLCCLLRYVVSVVGDADADVGAQVQLSEVY